MVPYNTGSKQDWLGLPVAGLLPGVLLPEPSSAYASDPFTDLAGPLQGGSPAPWVSSDLGVVSGASEPLWDVATLADLPQQLNLVAGSTAGGTASSLDFYPDYIQKPRNLHLGPGYVMAQQQQQQQQQQQVVVDVPIPAGAALLASPPLQVLDLSGGMGPPLPAMQQVHLPLSSIMASHRDQQLQIMQHSQAPAVAPTAASAAQGLAPVGMPALYQQAHTHMGLPPVPARATSGRGNWSQPQQQQAAQQQQQQQLLGRQPPMGTPAIASPAPHAPAVSEDAAGDSFWTRAAAQAARLQAEGGRRPGGRRSHSGPTLSYVTPAPPAGPGPGGVMSGSTITAQPGSFSERMSELLGSLKEGRSQGSASSSQAAPIGNPPSSNTAQHQQQRVCSGVPLVGPEALATRAKQAQVAGQAGSSSARGAARTDQWPGPARRYSACGSSSGSSSRSSSSHASSTGVVALAHDEGAQLIGAFNTGTQHLVLPQGPAPAETLRTLGSCGPPPAAAGVQAMPMPGAPGLHLLAAGQPPAAAQQWVLQQAVTGAAPGVPGVSPATGYSQGAATWPQPPPSVPW